MTMCYGAAGGNLRRVLRMSQGRFPNRNHPHHTMFARLHQCLREDGSVRSRCIAGRPRQTWKPGFEEVFERVGNDPSTSTRAIAHSVGLYQSWVLRVLQEQNLHANHLQKEQGLGHNDFAPRVRFVQWFLQRSVVNPAFPAQVLFTDEACFTRDGYFNSHIWDDENPHAVFIRVHQARFNVNIWGGILGDYMLGPFIFPDRLNGAPYLDFLQYTLPLLMEETSLRYAEKCGTNMMAL